MVTGATQPLGLRVLAELQEAGVGPLLAVGYEHSAELPEGVRYESVDLSRGRNVRTLLHGTCQEMGIGTVVHLAFHRRPGHRRAHRLHVDATRLMLRLSEEHPTIRRFVHRSAAEVYAARVDRPDLLREDHPLDLSPGAPKWIRERVEADVTVCTRMGMSTLGVAVLRCAEILAPDMGSQLYDYLGSRVCLRPLGFDPILNLLSLEDAGRAFALAARCANSGVFNIPGADTLPLSWATRKWGRDSIGIPGPLIGPLYRARAAVRQTSFRYDLNAWRFHFNGVLDGTRARDVLGYEPRTGIEWPRPDLGTGQAPAPGA